NHTRSVKDLINLTQNLDLYRFYPDISDDEGLGRLYADELGTIDIPEHIQNYFDYEAYGRDVRINEGGVFAPGGYVSAVPEGFKEYYHGPQDIPPEHRIFAYPEKAEPVHSILAALKRFQEAPPAPKKDKAGPSHEER
ncbi:antirestriction protein ArdA, partial [Clostridioides difficile]